MITASRARRAAGFTIVELMIALTVGGIAISSMYAIGAASTRHFREQQRISTTQSSLRAAMNQVKRDFQRAGFLGTPNAQLASESCTRGQISNQIDNTSGTADTGRIAAISAYTQNATRPTTLDPSNLNTWATVSDVILSGNYSTSGEYMGVTLAAGGRTNVVIPMTTQSFRRDFTNWYANSAGAPGQCDTRTLANAFPAGRVVRLHTLSEVHAFGVVSAVACNDASQQATITLSQALPNGCNVTSGWISPFNFIRYQVVNASTADEVSRMGANRVSVLRRIEVDPTNKANPLRIADSGTNRDADNRAVLDYVVRFSVRFQLRDAGGPSTVNFVDATQAAVRANPEFVRGVVIELAARTSEHEPDMSVTAATTRVVPFRVFDLPGAARTRSLRAELFLPNVALEVY